MATEVFVVLYSYGWEHTEIVGVKATELEATKLILEECIDSRGVELSWDRSGDSEDGSPRWWSRATKNGNRMEDWVIQCWVI